MLHNIINPLSSFFSFFFSFFVYEGIIKYNKIYLTLLYTIILLYLSRDEGDKNLDVSATGLCPAGVTNDENSAKKCSPYTSPSAPTARKSLPSSVSPPVSCPGSPTILSSKRFSPGPVPEAHNAGPAVWHGIKGSNMKRHMHVNFLIDVPPASLMAPVQQDISTLPLPPEDIARPSLSPSLAAMIAPRSPPLPDMSMTMTLAPQKSEDILNAIHALQLPERYVNQAF